MMKHKNLIRLGIAVLLAGFTFSCKPDPKEDPAPVDPKSRYFGSWTCNEHSKTDGTNASYTVHLVDSTGDYLLIESFYNQGFNRKAKATVSGDNMSMVVPQNINGFFIKNFSGHMDNASTISMSYVVNDGTADDSCTAVLNKQ
ncbi:MAG: hypothetical protein ACJ76F_10930 [Bacteroidia bacterium]